MPNLLKQVEYNCRAFSNLGPQLCLVCMLTAAATSWNYNTLVEKVDYFCDKWHRVTEPF